MSINSSTWILFLIKKVITVIFCLSLTSRLQFSHFRVRSHTSDPLHSLVYYGNTTFCHTPVRHMPIRLRWTGAYGELASYHNPITSVPSRKRGRCMAIKNGTIIYHIPTKMCCILDQLIICFPVSFILLEKKVSTPPNIIINDQIYLHLVCQDLCFEKL